MILLLKGPIEGNSVCKPKFGWSTQNDPLKGWELRMRIINEAFILSSPWNFIFSFFIEHNDNFS